MTVVNVKNITSKDWQRKRNSFGEVVEGLDDIRQCINTILKTVKGSVPLRPDFGCDAYKYIDYPLSIAQMHITREVISALSRWETRIEVTSVTCETTDQVGQLVVKILWKLKNSDIIDLSEVTYG